MENCLLWDVTADEAVKVWDSSTFQCLHTLAQDSFGWGQATALRWFHDPKYDCILAIGKGRGYVIFFHVAGSKMPKIYLEEVCRNIPIEDFDFSSSSRQFVVAEHSSRVHLFQFTADSQWVIKLSPTHIVCNIRIINGTEVHAYVLNTSKRIILSSQTGEPKDEKRFSTAAGDVAFSPDLKHILVDSLLNSFDLYTLDPFEKVKSFKVSPNRQLNKAKISTFIEDGTAITCPNYLQDRISIFRATSSDLADSLYHEQVHIIASHSSLNHYIICSRGKANGTIYVWRKRIEEGHTELYTGL
ncbi:hypothetical protein BKA70DRAFT_1421474 [Coprinopsis sp. MPI-PUGE-AT-0042]|nr:hypothetical protein BKA70DRAFT_1421474 [Coprinopsis sp. MPI-PUGE-AT-0042]